jgi:hypothetical protein
LRENHSNQQPEQLSQNLFGQAINLMLKLGPTSKAADQQTAWPTSQMRTVLIYPGSQ